MRNMAMHMGNESLLKILFTSTLILKFAQSLSGTFQIQEGTVDTIGDSRFRMVLGLFPPERRSIVDSNRLARARMLYEALTKKSLRQNMAVSDAALQIEGHGQFDGLVENELKESLGKKTSALQDKPYLQQRGKNDFLVLKSGVIDPFVTIIPNDIYYNVEKRCVNWLDDCNAKGIRARLLQRVQSPYR